MLTCSMKSSVFKTVACYFSAVFSRYSSRKTFFVVHQVVVSCKSIALYFVHVTLVVRLFRLRITPETSCYLLQLTMPKPLAWRLYVQFSVDITWLTLIVMLTANIFHIWSTLAGLEESTKGILGSGNEEAFFKYFTRFSIICCHVIIHVTALSVHCWWRLCDTKIWELSISFLKFQF